MTPDEAIRRAIALQQEGRVAEAADICRQVLEASPDHVDALHFLGVAEHQQGRSEVALTLLDRAVTLAPEHADLHSNRGNVFKQLGRLDEARRSYAEALALVPDHANALNNLGCVVRERGDLEAALELFRKVVAMEPGHADAHQNLGNCLGSLGRLDEGLGALRRALELRPAADSAYRHLGAMLYARDRVAEAAEVYKAWLSRKPENPEAKHLLVACSQTELPARAPPEFVRGLFDRFAPSFDGTLARLQYRAPSLVVEAIGQAVGTAHCDLDVLDVGCGTGLCAEGLRPFARTLVGVDLSARMLERARTRKLYDSLVECDLVEHMTRNPGAYDLLASADTLVYFGALDGLASAAASALRKGGYFAFTTERSEEAAAPLGYRLHPHGRYSHTRSYLQRVFGAVGLELSTPREVEPRLEAGAWVPGWLAVALRR